MSNDIIYHIAERDAWSKAQQNGEYVTSYIEQEGFIHLSKKEQVLRTLRNYYPKETEILLLFVNPDLLTSKLVFEAPIPPVGSKKATEEKSPTDPTIPAVTFPHLYGPLNPSAVVEAKVFTRTGDEWTDPFA